MTVIYKFIALLSVVLLGACSTRPNLAHIYQTDEQFNHQTTDYQQPPVILIPGLLGSRLIDSTTQKEVWPGSWGTLIFGDYDFLALDIDEATLMPAPSRYQPAGATSSAFGFDVYGSIMRTLETVGQFKFTQAGTKVSDKQRRYYVLSYDWRQDNVQAVRALDNLIEQIRLDYGKPNLQVDIVAHSMGGLIARYYLKYGRQDVLVGDNFPVTLHGDQRVRQAILLGTPNLGSLKALQSFIEGYKIGPNRVPTEVLATTPSAFQLLPHPSVDWVMTKEGKSIQHDLFSATVWQHFSWSIYQTDTRKKICKRFASAVKCSQYLQLLERYFVHQLRRARRFMRALSAPTPWQTTRFVVFGSDCYVTPARAVVEDITGQAELRLYPDDLVSKIKTINYERLMLDPGDGTVTKPSLLARQALAPNVRRDQGNHFPSAYSLFICEKHDDLSANITFQNNLLNTLLERK